MLKNVNFFALILAILVIAMFTCAGIAIALHNFLMMTLCLVIGSAIMGYGISLKKRQKKSDSI